MRTRNPNLRLIASKNILMTILDLLCGHSLSWVGTLMTILDLLCGHSLFGICDKLGILLLTKIRVSFSDLRDHRFNDNFNCKRPTCSCGFEDETSVHYFLSCSRYTAQRTVPSYIIGTEVPALPDDISYLVTLLVLRYPPYLMIYHIL